MTFNPFKIISVVTAVGSWAGKALADGKIDAMEAAELVTTIAAALGVKPEINV